MCTSFAFSLCCRWAVGGEVGGGVTGIVCVAEIVVVGVVGGEVEEVVDEGVWVVIVVVVGEIDLGVEQYILRFDSMS